jgi:hypothetical protein
MQRELRADEARSTPKNPLYHYTGEAALRGIIGEQKLWCFIHNTQRDQEEVQYSLDIARKVIQEEAKRGGEHAGSLLLGLDGMLGNNLLERFAFYFFSLSSHRDDVGQWDEYGDKRRGFAIGFAPALFQPDQEVQLARPAENVFVSQVIYGSDRTRTRHRTGIRKLAEITERVAKANPFLALKSRQAWFDNLNHAFLATQLIWNCLTAKCDRFSHEQETRYIIMGVRNTFDPCRRSRNGRDYVETPLPLNTPGNITEILVGPDAPANAEARVTELLRSHGYPDNVPVHRSAVRS